MKRRYLDIGAGSRKRVRVQKFNGGIESRYDESVLPLSLSPESYNFCFSGGTLTPGYGLTAYPRFDGHSLKSVWLFRRYDRELKLYDDRLMALTNGGAVLECPAAGGAVRVLPGITLSVPPSVTNYRLYGEDVVIMCTERDGMFVYNGVDEPYHVSGAPFITSLTLHYERLFVTVGGEKNAVWFSDDLDPTNFDVSLSGGGFIELIDERGASGRVVSFNNYVYIFRDYGISRLSAYAEQTGFSLVNLYVGGGKIFFDSVCVSGDRILFLASDGLYAFDGYGTVRIAKGLEGMSVDGAHASAAYAGGHYYLSFRSSLSGEPFMDETANSPTNNLLLVYDISTGTTSLSRGMDIVTLTALKDVGGVAAVTAGGAVGLIERCGRYFDAPLPKKWRIPKTGLGSDGVKRLQEMRLFSKTDCRLRFFSDEREKTVAVKGGTKECRVRPAFNGHRIGIDILCGEADCNIGGVSLTVNQ